MSCSHPILHHADLWWAAPLLPKSSAWVSSIGSVCPVFYWSLMGCPSSTWSSAWVSSIGSVCPVFHTSPCWSLVGCPSSTWSSVWASSTGTECPLLIPYFTMLVFGGLSLFYLELCLGQFHRYVLFSSHTSPCWSLVGCPSSTWSSVWASSTGTECPVLIP
jgi:hypothetical protein